MITEHIDVVILTDAEGDIPAKMLVITLDGRRIQLVLTTEALEQLRRDVDEINRVRE